MEGRRIERGEDWRSEREGWSGQLLGMGTQCCGGELIERYMKEAGTQLGRTEGHTLAMAFRLHRPKPQYRILKFLAELFAVQADLEAREAAQSKRDRATHLNYCRVLALLDKSFLASSARTALEEDQVGPKASQLTGLSAPEEKALLRDVAALPPSIPQRTFQAALQQRYLLSLADLSEIAFTFALGFEATDAAVKGQLEALAETPTKVIASEDKEHYQSLAAKLKTDAFNHPLIWAPALAEEHGVVREADGVVELKRVNAKTQDRTLSADWLSLKVLAILYDVLAHLPAQDRKRILDTPGAKWQLVCLGCLDRTFLRVEQKAVILAGRKGNLDAAAELDVLKELSIASKNASILPIRQVAKAARRIQKAIMLNCLFSVQELQELFTDLSYNFNVPEDLYQVLLKELTKQEHLTKTDSKTALSKLTAEERRNGVLLINQLAFFRGKMRRCLVGYAEGVKLMEVGGKGRKEGAEGAEEPEEDEEKLVPKGKDVEVALLLLYDLVMLKRHGARRSAFHLEAYRRSLEYLNRAGGGGEMVTTAKGYLNSAITRNHPLPLTELVFLVGLVGSSPCITKADFTNLLNQLLSHKYIPRTTYDSLLANTPCPISPNALRHVFDKLIQDHD